MPASRCSNLLTALIKRLNTPNTSLAFLVPTKTSQPALVVGGRARFTIEGDDRRCFARVVLGEDL